MIRAQRYVRLRSYPPPLELPAFTSYLSWHERSHRDPGHVWFRTALQRAAREAYGELLIDAGD